MSKAKWYNPTGEPAWDNYYRVWWLTAFPIGLFMIAILVKALLS